MIPEKQKENIKEVSEKDKIGSFDFFDITHFIKRLIKNWYWFLLLGITGYTIAYIYNKYYAQRIYASSTTISISNNSSSYFTPNQSINFIWGQSGNTEGMYLKKLLLSRTHNEFLAQKLDLFVNYTTKGRLKSTFLDKNDSPVFFVIDKEHLQIVNVPITIIPMSGDRYEISLPENFKGNNLYNYKTETFKRVDNYTRVPNKIIKVGEWYETAFLKFKLDKNFQPRDINVENVVVNLATIDQTVNDIKANISVDFDSEISSFMIITKKGYNLNNTVSFLNKSIEALKEKRMVDKSTVDLRTVKFIKENLAKAKLKLDSSTAALNAVKVQEKMTDEKGDVEGILSKIKNLEEKKVEILTKVDALNSIKNSVGRNIDDLININTAGVEDPSFNASVSELKSLYKQRAEMVKIYTPRSEPIQEINRLINEAKGASNKHLKRYYDVYGGQLAKVNQEIYNFESSLGTLPFKQQRFLDAQRGYTIDAATYNTLLEKLSEAEMRLKINVSDISVIDEAKNLGQGPIAPNTSLIRNALLGGMLLIPFIILLIVELLDNKVRVIRELLSATKIPLLGVIGKNNNDNNLTVLEQPKSSVSEAFRGVRANLKFLYKEDGKSKVILVTSY